ncbi:MAG: hypothetical protein JNM39_10350 [Bdellovibrionaceae bacterium]|nr:hypothetical protein [Pseudobdellovibrionaceae bacterium]
MTGITAEAKIVRIENLKAIEIKQMYELFEQYYECISFETFQKDLQKKDAAVVIRDEKSHVIRGFSTYKILSIPTQVDGVKKAIRGMFSGDTIVAKELWGSKILNGAIAKIFLIQKLRYPLADFHWFLISKGYKTYLGLTNNFTDFYPRFDDETPEIYQQVIDSYALALYPESYDRESGLLKFKESLGQLKAHVTPIDLELMNSQPHVRFFQERNPDWSKGDELVCVGIVNWKMFLMYGLKVLGLSQKKQKALQRQPTSL